MDEQPSQPILDYANAASSPIPSRSRLVVFLRWMFFRLDGQLTLLATYFTLLCIKPDLFEILIDHFPWRDRWMFPFVELATIFLFCCALSFWPVIILYHFILKPPRGRDRQELLKPIGNYLFIAQTLSLYSLVDLFTRPYQPFHTILELINTIAYWIFAYNLMRSGNWIKRVLVSLVVLLMLADSVRIQQCPHALNMNIYGVIIDIKGRDCRNPHEWYHWWNYWW